MIPNVWYRPGYAPFCKHLLVENFCGALSTVLAITPENEGLLRSGYVVRQEGELAVLSRWFPATAVGAPPVAKWLDVILYSREQIRKENEVCQRVYLQTSVSSRSLVAPICCLLEFHTQTQLNMRKIY